MNTRLEQFLAAENISQSQLADTLGVARASISHILAGRNKPGYEFVTNLMRCYPALNIEWLMLGKGKMYKSSEIPQSQEAIPATAQPEEPAPTLFDSPSEPSEVSENQQVEQTPQIQSPNPERKIVSVIAFYSDGTFTELK